MNSSLSISSFFSVLSLGDNTSVAKEFLTCSISLLNFFIIFIRESCLVEVFWVPFCAKNRSEVKGRENFGIV